MTTASLFARPMQARSYRSIVSDKFGYFTMSTEIEGKCGTPSSCASCGVAEGDAIKLKKCAACHLVQYCSVECQREHRPKHKRACKKRAAELRDEILFRQPESSHFGDCPICYLPLSLDTTKSPLQSCCSKIICNGCSYAYKKRHAEQSTPRCPFCRQPRPKSQTEAEKQLKDRAEMNDPVALREVGYHAFESGNYQSAYKYWSNAVELGDATSHFELALLYHYGHGVERDESKAVHHYEQAAIDGHPGARNNIGCFEWKNGRCERAMKHWIIAAKLGHDKSLNILKEEYKNGLVSKDDFAAALRGHQAAVDVTKSLDREAAEAIKN